MDVGALGKVVLYCGLCLIGVGVLLLVCSKVPFFGRLPGDFLVQKKHFTFYFPLATSVLVSAAVSLLLWIFFRR